MINVLIVDDDPFIRESMHVILELDSDLHVAGVCGNGLEAAEFVRQQSVDVVVMDIRMPVCDGVEGTKLLRALDAPPSVLILTTFDDDEYIAQAIRNGANGYLLKNVPPSRIISGIKTVHEGSMLIHPDIARKLADMLEPSRGDKDLNKTITMAGLTQAESQIVRHIADGKSNKEIAASLFLSEGTIKNYITEILHKLELRDRTQIAIFYLKLLHQ
ncbi:DNA-binding NarL/FixJ family response regulator [Paenibacillus castaneae]|uniref:response regulator transcription factor n=1 Tax=Paenibacillus castaneae TaxID=474957 RepID=UPI000C9BB9CD|nr:response regulator transcription factor [Paenibacillus castaneae]NIK75780.1 DNA-binding NarL/FixJ family response regulator [Paenibacillus castaneae]